MSHRAPEFGLARWIYEWIQRILERIFSTPTSSLDAPLSKRLKVAIIGAGITGVAAAAHCVGHGVDVKIFEAASPEGLGGVWSQVNDDSGLQIHSFMYRFHPSVRWQSAYPYRKQIVDEIVKLWERYELGRRTKFHFRVDRILQDCEKRWIINDPSNGTFDGVVVAVGTCAHPKAPYIPKQEGFKGKILHSSQLDGQDPRGKKILIVGGGASAAEAAEFVAGKDAAEVSVLSRSDKWILPRNIIIQILFALNIFGQETFLSWIPETLLRRYFYRDLRELAPTDLGVFTRTPLANSNLLTMVRSGKMKWLRGKVENFEENGLRFHRYAKDICKSVSDRGSVIEGDMVIMATGYLRPNLGFLPRECLNKPYPPPNWYLQAFPPNHLGICAINCTYVEGIGTIGNFHIGVYTRILIMFLLDPLTRPQERQVKAWIDAIRWLKSKSPGGAFEFVTYSEIHLWFFFCIAINPFRWRWLLFVFFGIDTALLAKNMVKRKSASARKV